MGFKGDRKLIGMVSQMKLAREFASLKAVELSSQHKINTFSDFLKFFFAFLRSLPTI
jgi:hypothetical protein